MLTPTKSDGFSSGGHYNSSKQPPDLVPRDALSPLPPSYPAGVRSWIKRRGGLTQKIIYLRGKELAALYPRC